MATDLFGPGSNAPNVTTTRPADTRVFATVDTWIKDCSTPLAQDGTAIQAGWLNGIIGGFRALIRGNGQTAALADIIPVNNADDTMALRSIQTLIQRGQTRFGIDTGTADNLVVALSPALAEYKAGVSLKVLVLHDGTGAAANITVNGLGTRNITRQDSSPLQKGDLIAGSVITLDDDGSEFQLAIPAGFSNAARIVTSSATLTLTLQDHAIALQRTTSVAAMNILLPANGKNGHIVEIEDVQGNLQGATATVIPDAGDTGGIAGNTAGYVMNRNLQSTKFRLYVSGSTRIWSRSTP